MADRVGSERYAKYVNPQWVRLLDLLGMNVRYERCTGSELFTETGRCVYDFLSGFCVYNAGHNHPAIIAALKDELDKNGPSMLQSHVPQLAGVVAERLCKLAGGSLKRVFFTSSGSEGVETAIKFSRAYTKRDALLYCDGAFHGLTCGALSLMGDPFWKEGFGPMLQDTEAIPFNDLVSLEQKLASKKFAAFIVEPVQSEGGIRLPEGDYLREAQRLCRRYVTLFVLDEVQTGMYRTGAFLAGQHYGVEPDMVILAKAMSGGLIPVGAVLMTQALGDCIFSSLKRAIIHASTFGENALAMRAVLATLDVLEGERWGEKSAALGVDFRRKIGEALAPYEMFKEVRGLGMLSGIEWKTPQKFQLKIPFEVFKRIHPGMFGQILVMNLYCEKGILTQICGNHFMVLKVAPPLTSSPEQLDYFVKSIAEIAEVVHGSGGFWADAIAMMRNTVHV